MPRPALLAAFSLAPLVVLAGASSADAAELKWKFAPGQQLSYETTQNSTGTVKFGTRSFDIKTDLRLVTDWRVKEVAADGTAVVEQTYRRVRVASPSPAAPGETVTWDSEEGGEVPIPQLKGYAALAGSTLTVTFAPDGRATKVEIPQPVRDAVAAGGAGGLTVELLEQLAGDFGFTLPDDGTAEPGESWQAKRSTALPGLGTLEETRTMTLKDASQRAATIDVETDLNVAAGGGNDSIGKGTQRSTVRFDPAAGRLESIAGTQTIELKDQVREIKLDATLSMKRVPPVAGPASR